MKDTFRINGSIDDITFWLADYLHDHFYADRMQVTLLGSKYFVKKIVRHILDEHAFVIYKTPLIDFVMENDLVENPELRKKARPIPKEGIPPLIYDFTSIKLFRLKANYTEIVVESDEEGDPRLINPQEITKLKDEIFLRWVVSEKPLSDEKISIHLANQLGKPGRPIKYSEWVERLNTREDPIEIKKEFLECPEAKEIEDPESAWKRITRKARGK